MPELATQLLVTLRGHTARIAKPSWSPDGARIATASDDGTVRIWDAKRGQCTAVLRSEGSPLSGAAWNARGSMIAAGDAEGSVFIWELSSSERMNIPPAGQTPLGGSPAIRSVTWNDNRLVIGSDDHTVRTLHPFGQHDELVAYLYKPLFKAAQRVTCVAYSADRQHLAAAGDDGLVTIFSASGAAVAIRAGNSHALCVAWWPDRHAIAAGTSGGEVVLFDIATGARLGSVRAHMRSVGGVSFSSDGSMLASKSSQDGTVKLWTVPALNQAGEFAEAGFPFSKLWMNGLEFHPNDSAILATLGEGDEVARIWRLGAEHPSPKKLRIFLCHSSGDKPAVRDLHAKLCADGHEPWLDEEDLLPGEDWDSEIRKAVRAAHVVLVCISTRSIAKTGYLQKELKFVLDVADEQPEGKIFLIPARIEACELPERISRWQAVDLFHDRGYERLLKALSKRAASI